MAQTRHDADNRTSQLCRQRPALHATVEDCFGQWDGFRRDTSKNRQKRLPPIVTVPSAETAPPAPVALNLAQLSATVLPKFAGRAFSQMHQSSGRGRTGHVAATGPRPLPESGFRRRDGFRRRLGAERPAGIRAVADIVPVTRPSLAPAEGTSAMRAGLLWQVGLADSARHQRSSRS